MRRQKKYSQHHIIPRSRGGVTTLGNTVMLTRSEHEAYHTLFANKNPDEIIDYLVRHFWKGNWDWVHQALLKLLY